MCQNHLSHPQLLNHSAQIYVYFIPKYYQKLKLLTI